MNDEIFLEESWHERFLARKKTFFVCLAAIALLACTAVPFLSRFKGSSTTDFLKTSLSYQHFTTDPSSFESLKISLEKHPELETKFGALIARQFLIQGQGTQAATYAQNVLNRAKNNSLHSRFAKTSLLIGKGELQTALAEANSLKADLDNNPLFREKSSPHEALFYLYNLLRISALEREVGTPLGERLALEEFERAATISPATQQAYVLLQQNLKKDNITLSTYITHRKNIK